jgi:putative flippase GtrA
VSIGLLATHRARLVRVIKYASASAIATTISLAVLGILVGVVGLGGVWSNVIATAVGTFPSFELNRRWVWSDTRGGRRLRQMVPFCALSAVGVLVSSLAVRLAAQATAQSGRLVHTLAVEVANVGSYGALWLVRFAMCDKVLFRGQSMQRALLGGDPTLDRISGLVAPGPHLGPDMQSGPTYEETSAR